MLITKIYRKLCYQTKIGLKVRSKKHARFQQMKKTIYLISFLTIIMSCSKNETINPIEVFYHDWDPDTLFYLGENDSFAIDLNNDNIDDLKFERETNYGFSPSGGDYFISSRKNVSSLNEDLKISLGKQHPNSVLSYSGWNCLKFSDWISNALTWGDNFNLNGYVAQFGESFGVWDRNDYDGYIGLKFEMNQSTYFGWIKLTDTLYSMVRLDKYAISETQNAVIYTGQSE